jgi:hypothetical protein
MYSNHGSGGEDDICQDAEDLDVEELMRNVAPCHW